MPVSLVRGSTVSYDVVGAGDAVLLLHGGLAGSDCWLAQTPALLGPC